MDRVYDGILDLYYYNNTISIVLTAQEEKLISSIAASEMRDVRDVEAIKAFAIVIRSFLVQQVNRRLSYTLIFLIQLTARYSKIKILRLMLEKRFIKLNRWFFHITIESLSPVLFQACGGRTATYEEAWGKPSDGYDFPSVSCPCNSDRWVARFSDAELSEISD